MIRQLSLAVGLAVLLAAGCAPEPEPVDTSADVAAVNDLASREMAAFTAGDTAAIASMFAEDVILMAPNEPAIQGRDALIQWASGLHEQFTLGGRYTSSEVSVSGDLAVHRFTGELSMTPKAGGDSMSQTVQGVHVLRRQPDGTWQITHDVWNSSQPLMPPAVGGQ